MGTDQLPRSDRMPDTESQEAMVYGSAYTQVKMQLMEIDHELEIVKSRKASILDALDLDAAECICEDDIGITYTEADLPEGYNEDIAVTVGLLREYNRLEWARMWLEDAGARITMGGRMIGATEHALKLNSGNHDETLWRAASLRAAQVPLEYASLKVR